MGDLEELFEKGKSLTAADTQQLIDQERELREVCEANPTIALYYEILFRKYLSKKESSEILGNKMLSWQRKRDEDRKKLMNEKLNNKLDNERPKNYMPKNDKLKNEKLENTTEISMHCS